MSTLSDTLFPSATLFRRQAERRNLLFDAFFVGLWVAAMQFNPLPTAVTRAMMAMNNVSIGGLRFMFAGAAVQMAGIALGLAIFPLTSVPMTSSAQLRSEEHTSELQSLMRISYAVFCLKKKKK